MPTMTAGRLPDADHIRSYADIVAAHRDLSRKVAEGKGAVYAAAAARVTRLGGLYRAPEVLTGEMRTIAETALAAIREVVRTPRPEGADRFVVADTWLDQLSLLTLSPDDGR